MPKKGYRKPKVELPADPDAKTSAVVEIKAVASVENEYNVPTDKWDKLSEEQRSRFNTVYSSMRLSPSLFTHPNAVTVPAEHWTTIAWNAAWVAAGA